MTPQSYALARNTLWQLGGKAIGLVLGVAAVAIMTRYLGPEGYGYYATITAYLAFFSIAVDFGLNVFVVQMLSERAYAPEEERRLASVFFTLRVMTAAGILGVAVLIVKALSYPEPVAAYTWIAAFSFWAIVAHQILVGIFQTKLAMSAVAYAEVFSRLALVSAVGAVAWLDLGFPALLWATVVGSVTNILITWVALRRHVRVWFAWDGALVRQILSRSWPVGLSVLFNLVYLRADTLILAWFRSAPEVGFYGASYRVVDILVMFPTMFVGLVFPFLSRSFAQGDKPAFARMMQDAFDALVLMVLPLLVGAYVLGEEIMVFLAGSAFAPSGDLLKILIFATFFIYLGNLFMHAVVAVHRQKRMVWGYAAVAAVTLAGYVVLIPRFGAIAAAWLTVGSEALATAIAAVIVVSVSGVSLSLRRVARGVVAATGMGALVWWTKPLGLWSAIGVGAVSYGIFIIAARAVSYEFVRNLVKSKQ